ncbi:hypothetical protein [Thermaurantiacus tibetensis]|uniref:hypothetical protein n=1 Tax=Thermaurantiacus tibetensis TaxID=2759035 RepID=UPI00188F989E|nr:hypothetical protein [Thermaurantiacus tibetensis]
MFAFRLLACILIILGSAPASAAPAAGSRRWTFTAEPYLMAPFMNGATGIGPVRFSGSTSPRNLFANLNWGVMGLLEANNGRFGLAFDGTYMNLEMERRGLVDRVGGHQGAYAVMGLARIHRFAEAYAGVRVNDLGVDISATDPRTGAPVAVRNSETWVDPLVGLRVRGPLSRTVDLAMLADVGGFGAGSDIAAQAWPTLGVRLSESVQAKLGYRVIYMKYETGEGLRAFRFDVMAHGPTAGIRFRF